MTDTTKNVNDPLAFGDNPPTTLQALYDLFDETVVGPFGEYEDKRGTFIAAVLAKPELAEALAFVAFDELASWR